MQSDETPAASGRDCSNRLALPPCHEVIPECAASGSCFRELPLAEWPTPSRKDMPPLLMYWQSMKAMYGGLRTRLGPFRAVWMLVASALPLRASDKPRWHSEYFHLKSAEEEKFFQQVFREFAMLITLFNKLKRRFGEKVADQVTGTMAIPMTVPYLRQAFHPVETLTSIDPILQQLSDYLAEYIGEEKGFEGQAFVSEDRTEARLFVTKCAYMHVLLAYGLKMFAAKACFADHVVFDTLFPDLVFSRKHTIGVGDAFCDHAFRLRASKDLAQDPDQYGDCHKTADGMEDVLRWEKVLAKE